jgi:hypothetical protein
MKEFRVWEPKQQRKRMLEPKEKMRVFLYQGFCMMRMHSTRTALSVYRFMTTTKKTYTSDEKSTIFTSFIYV